MLGLSQIIMLGLSQIINNVDLHHSSINLLPQMQLISYHGQGLMLLLLGWMEIFDLTTHSTHFIYSYMMSDIW